MGSRLIIAKFFLAACLFIASRLLLQFLAVVRKSLELENLVETVDIDWNGHSDNYQIPAILHHMSPTEDVPFVW